MRNRRHPVLIGCLAAVLALFAGSSVRAEDYPESADGLKKLNEDILAAIKGGEQVKAAALIKTMVLPKADEWMKKTFGDEKGAALAAGYAKMSASMDTEVLKMYEAQLAKNRTVVSAYKLTDGDDAKAVGFQKDAMAAMKEKVPLYGVRITEPGKPLGQHLYNFVYVDGAFRLVGKLPVK